jgi:sirohydrochlorin ferrochelatase
MELCPPTLSEAFQACAQAAASEVLIMPYFLGPGRHASEDIPQKAAEAAALCPGISYRIAEPFGVHPLLVELVLDRLGIEA